MTIDMVERVLNFRPKALFAKNVTIARQLSRKNRQDQLAFLTFPLYSNNVGNSRAPNSFRFAARKWHHRVVQKIQCCRLEFLL